MLRRASTHLPSFTARIPMRMSALLSRNTSRPGLIGIARVDRNIDRLLRRVCPGDIVVLDVLDLDRITADALVEAEIAAVVNASSSVSGRYPNLGPEVLVTNGVTLIDETGPEIFKKVKDGAKVRLYEGGVYAGDRRLIRGTERTDHDIADLMREAKSGLVAHLEAFAGNTIEFIRSESPLLIDGIGIPDVDVDLRRRHVVIVADEPSGPDDLKSLKPFIKGTNRCWLVWAPARTCCARRGIARSSSSATLTKSAPRCSSAVPRWCCPPTPMDTRRAWSESRISVSAP